jgi:hypothetical protein
VNSNQYVSITINEGNLGEELFGARAGGGVDHIYFQGGWQTVPVNSNSYLALVGDRGAGQNEFYGAQTQVVPEPTASVLFGLSILTFGFARRRK